MRDFVKKPSISSSASSTIDSVSTSYSKRSAHQRIAKSRMSHQSWRSPERRHPSHHLRETTRIRYRNYPNRSSAGCSYLPLSDRSRSLHIGNEISSTTGLVLEKRDLPTSPQDSTLSAGSTARNVLVNEAGRRPRRHRRYIPEASSRSKNSALVATEAATLHENDGRSP